MMAWRWETNRRRSFFIAMAASGWNCAGMTNDLGHHERPTPRPSRRSAECACSSRCLSNGGVSCRLEQPQGVSARCSMPPVLATHAGVAGNLLQGRGHAGGLLRRSSVVRGRAFLWNRGAGMRHICYRRRPSRPLSNTSTFSGASQRLTINLTRDSGRSDDDAT